MFYCSYKIIDFLTIKYPTNDNIPVYVIIKEYILKLSLNPVFTARIIVAFELSFCQTQL